MFSPRELGLERGWPGRIEGDRVIQLAAQTLQAFFTGGGQAREHAGFDLDDVVLRAPVLHPPSLRIYRDDALEFGNPASIYGPGETVPFPGRTLRLEVALAAVIGPEGTIGGFTVLNDWSARDLQRAEMRVGLGPAKGKDFATSIGPVLVTPDEFDGTSGTMTARVNGEERSRGELRDMFHGWDALLEQSARNTVLRPGDVIGSGTVGNGCILEHGDGRWLERGDVVELEIEGIGVLRNTIA
jgi:fumarylacetoacetate (FAA) hydrolase